MPLRSPQLIALALVALELPAIAETNPSKRQTLTVVVHASSPVDNLSKTELRKLLLGETNRWPDRRQVVIVEREAGSQVYRQMLYMVLQMTPMDYKRHLVEMEFQGNQPPLIKTLNSDDGAIQFARSVPGAIAVVDASSSLRVASTVKTLRIDGKLPGAVGYPLQ